MYVLSVKNWSATTVHSLAVNSDFVTNCYGESWDSFYKKIMSPSPKPMSPSPKASESYTLTEPWNEVNFFNSKAVYGILKLKYSFSILKHNKRQKKNVLLITAYSTHLLKHYYL